MFASKDALFSGAAGGYTVNNSLRFRSAASAYLNRTFSTPTSSTVYTLSMWVKRGALSVTQNLFGASTTTRFGFNSSDQLVLVLAGTTAVTTTAVYRDLSSWYHIIYTQNGSAQTIYVNGTSVGTGTTANTVFNTAIAHQLAAANTTNYFDGYLAEINFVDGQTLTPSSFGATGSNGVWQPIQYTGTYGANGFYLKFASFGTAAALGNDSSGNGNTWTINNINVSAGVTYDPMLDTPTLTSATVANYSVLNPLGKASTGAVANGNLTFTNSSATTYPAVGGTIFVSSGKWYWESVVSGSGTFEVTVGISTLTTFGGSSFSGGSPLSAYWNSGQGIGKNGSYLSATPTFTYGDVIGIAYDADAGTVTFYKNNTAQTPVVTGVTGTYAPAFSINYYTAPTLNVNFGQQPFSYTPPTGFVRLNAYNISAGTITTSGSFTGNALADGPFIWLNGTPTAMTINGNAVTFGTHADKLANGFKVRTTSTSYNSTGSNTYSVSTTDAQFKYEIAQGNP
jgi:hypothetical protein